MNQNTRLDEYCELFRTRHVDIILESPDLDEIIKHLNSLGYNTGLFKQLPGSDRLGYLEVDGGRNNDNDNLAVISGLDFNESIVYRLIQGVNKTLVIE